MQLLLGYDSVTHFPEHGLFWAQNPEPEQCGIHGLILTMFNMSDSNEVHRAPTSQREITVQPQILNLAGTTCSSFFIALLTARATPTTQGITLALWQE